MLIMFKINKILSNITKFQTISLRLLDTEFHQNSNELSVRQQTWLESHKKYENYEHILYSSYLELQDEQHMSYGLRRSLHMKLKKKFQLQQKQPKIWYQNVSDVPKDWMEDFEHYSGSERTVNNENQQNNNLGKANPTIPASNVPCNGCGAHLHCNHHTTPGFIPEEIFKGRTQNELKTIICQRCHFLKNYNLALDIEVAPEYYIETISQINDQFALAIVIVDLLDFPCSIWPGMHKLLGPKRPVFIVGNKVDLLPRDCNSYLNHIKQCLNEEVIKAGFDRLNVKYVSLISAKTGYGIEELITQLQKIWAYKGNVYLLGCTNVGKSSLFNVLLNSDYSRPETANLIRKATTCPWPGTTLQMLKFPIYRPSDIRVYNRFKRLNSQKWIKAEEEKLRIATARKSGNISDAVPVGAIGRTFVHNADDDVDDIFAMSKGTQPITTFNERSKEYQKARWVYDTPGVMHPDQITNLLTSQELVEVQPKQMISPRSYRLKPGMSLLVAGLARLDFIKCYSNLEWLQIFLFSSLSLPTIIVKTDHASEVYEKYLNTPLLHVPMGNEERLKKWPGLQCHPDNLNIRGYILKPKLKEQNCSADITLSSAGWVGLRVPIDEECLFKAWTPYGRGIYLRTPSLVPYAERLIGKRIRNSLSYNTAKPFIFKK